MRANYVWMNGEILPWDRGQVHVMTHALHYGTSVYEGIRAYDVGGRANILCGPAHFERLTYSCKVARIPCPYTIEQWMTAASDILRANEQRSAYLRPLVFRGAAGLEIDGRKCPVEAIIAAIPWGAYLGEEAIQQGVEAQVSSWPRVGSSLLAKIGGQYVNSAHIAMEAHDNGFAEGISLDARGYVSKGSGENIFMVYKNEILTPTLANSVLSGVTRACVMTIARDLGYTVTETNIPREMLYMADELFFTGTAAEVCPIRAVDRIQIGEGRRGPVTKAIQDVFFGILKGKRPDKWGWLAPVR